MQNHLNLLYREEEREMLPLCRSEGIGVIPGRRSRAAGWRGAWSKEPPTQRAETDAFGEDALRQNRRCRPRRLSIGSARSRRRAACRAAQVALAWLLQKPGVTAPIVGATKPRAFERRGGGGAVKLSAEEMKALEKDYVPHAVAGFLLRRLVRTKRSRRLPR